MASCRVIVAVFGLLAVSSSHQVKGEDEYNLDMELDKMVAHHREKRVLCNTVNAANQRMMANNLGTLFGKRAFSSLINCTQPTFGGGRYADSCIYSGSGGRLINSKISNLGSNIIFGKRDQSQFIGKPKRDIIFLIDDSGSIPAQQFSIAKQGAVDLLVSFCPEKLGADYKQIAVVLFSSQARTLISYKDSHKGADWLATKLQGLSQARGSTATAAALRHVREHVLTSPGSRLNDPDTSTHVIVVTDGQCNQGCQELKSEAKKLREAGPGVQLFALGVSNARACELDIITGNGADLAFGVSDFNSFQSFAKSMREVAKDEFKGCI